ncbi:MAG: Arc family DNA-binding protein [Rhodocyclales bacterium]|nr:Arc family DNA-binding protein [Rhodocyclales bacterium]
MTNDQHRSQYRIPYPLYERLKAEAEAQQRSVNAEIVARLEASFLPAPATIEQLAALLDERDARLLEEVRSVVRGAIGKLPARGD